MKTVGIIGGMGTLATIDLFNKIAIETNAKSDSEHLHILIDNNAQIPDRTKFILGDGENPTYELEKSAMNLEKIGADFLAIPCNTAHYFYNNIDRAVGIEVVNMIEETAKNIKKDNINKVGLLATSGTIKSGIYDRIFKDYDIEIVKLSDNEQSIIMDFIYSIKEGRSDFERDKIVKIFDNFNDLDVSKVILGCTELPVGIDMLDINGDFIDPTNILARVCVEKAKYG
ncbi:MAG: amino acid racemase [Romboutsia sp.]